MISTSSYLASIEQRRDLLAAYSALDHQTTAGLSDHAVDAALLRLVARLSTLVALHGPGVPQRFLDTLRELGSADGVRVVASFLESGTPNAAGEQPAWELQQEILHFSRIVDIGDLGLDAPDARRSIGRLRGSDRLPESLKSLSELTIVARSRLLQRGADLPVPSLRPRPPISRDLGQSATISSPHEQDYLLAVGGGRRRTRRQTAFLLTALLDYLTPEEAALALWAHLVGAGEANLEVALAVRRADGSAGFLSWCRAAAAEGVDPVDRCRALLPAVENVGPGEGWSRRLGDLSLVVTRSGDQVSARLDTHDGTHHTATLVAPPTAPAVTIGEMEARVPRLLAGVRGLHVASIECGHVHLDRDVDADQEVGLRLGLQALRLLAEQQATPPALTPMVDDDHVLVRLRPVEYRRFLARHLGGLPVRLIPESSPIVRGIVCALWRRMHQLGLAERCRERGGNVFVQLDQSGSHCELFEDYGGAAINGCVLFECALLVYRTAPALFDDYVRRRFGLSRDVHEIACEILSEPVGHDEMLARLNGFYGQFEQITDPHRPDMPLSMLADEVIEGAAPAVGHLNVLEDYYEVQQGKVRALLRLLELPLRLLTVHFNARTGRTAFDG